MTFLQLVDGRLRKFSSELSVAISIVTGVPETAASTRPALPVARVAVDVSLSHLDRSFDYAVTPAQDGNAVPGARVRVRFAGKLRDGFVLERSDTTEHAGTLAPLHKVVSAEPVLTAEVARLIRKVADHYAGCFADVMRLAVPPRHAATESANRVTRPPLPDLAETPAGPFTSYGFGPELVAALRSGRSPRAAWQVIPTAGPEGDWADGFAQLARATADSGRGSVLIVPDQHDLARLREACQRHLGRVGFVELTGQTGPSARYRAFLAALRGDVLVVIGNRAAAFAPVRALGLVAVFDDGDDLLSEPRAPYPHARDVLALRASATGAAMVAASYARSAEVQQWVERGWLRELSADRAELRRCAPRVKASAATDHALERDPLARAARLPREVFELMRAALAQGPVLVQVPRGGYLLSLVCDSCREPARCHHCHGPTTQVRRRPGQDGASPQPAPPALTCTWCGRLQVGWACPICNSRKVRAPVVGAERTAEELGRAFPQTPVRQSMGGRVLSDVPDTPSIVVATPGAEPPTEHGYAGAVLLDTDLALLRPDLRAGAEALRRWLNAVALVRPGAEGGSVIAVGESGGREIQALIRIDPAGHAQRELEERLQAHFPPAVKMVLVEGSMDALHEFGSLLRPTEWTEALGPVEVEGSGQPLTAADDSPLHRLTLRAPLIEGSELVAGVKAVTNLRSARKSDYPIRIRVDPVQVG